MYQANYVEDSVVGFCTLAESFQIDHIPAYTTLISINSFDLKKLQKDKNWVPEVQFYESGTYFNAFRPAENTEKLPNRDEFGYYAHEKSIMASLFQRSPIIVEEYLVQVLARDDFLIKSGQ